MKSEPSLGRPEHSELRLVSARVCLMIWLCSQWTHPWPLIGQTDHTPSVIGCLSLTRPTRCEPEPGPVSVHWTSVCENPEKTIWLLRALWGVLKPQRACFVIPAELRRVWAVAAVTSYYGVINEILSDDLSRRSPGPRTRDCISENWKGGRVLAESFVANIWLCPMHLGWQIVSQPRCTIYLTLDKWTTVDLIQHSFS